MLIYKATNKITKKCYVGKTKNTESKRGKKNPLKSLHMKENNPNKRPDVREKIRQAHIGRKRPNHSKRMKELWSTGKYDFKRKGEITK